MKRPVSSDIHDTARLPFAAGLRDDFWPWDDAGDGGCEALRELAVEGVVHAEHDDKIAVRGAKMVDVRDEGFAGHGGVI